MSAKINCFVPFKDKAQVDETLNGLKQNELVSKIYLLSTDNNLKEYDGCNVIAIDGLNSTATMKAIASASDSEFSLLYTKYTTLSLGYFALERMVGVAEDSQAAMLYADHYQFKEGKKQIAPVIDYQYGALRDDCNFGSVF